MRAKIIFTVLVLAVACVMGVAFAQPSEEAAGAPQPPPGEQKEELAKAGNLRQEFLKEQAELRARVLEKRAALIRLTAQETADEKEIQKLTEEIGELRAALQKKCAEYRGSVAPVAFPGAPWRGIGAGAPGPYDQQNLGWGRGWGAGAGPVSPRLGRGPGFGRGQGLGLGPGRGMGAWSVPPARGGPGFGPRGSFGLRPGRGMGPYGIRPSGPGPFFRDEDSDGVCDYWEAPLPPAGIPPRPGVKPPEPPAGASEQPSETE